MKKKIILIVFVMLICVVGGLVYWGQHRERSAELYYSGTIEATQAHLAFQVNGRVASVQVREGQPVRKGQTLATLEMGVFSARCDQARANRDLVRQTLDQGIKMLEINRVGRPVALERAQAAARSFELKASELESGFRTQEIKQARLAAEASKIALDEARRDKDRIDSLYKRQVVSAREKDAADLRFETALKTYQQATEAHELMKEGMRKDTIDAARSRLAEAQAAVKLARNDLKHIEVAEMEVAAAKARVQSAEAALALAEIDKTHASLTSPVDGLLISRNVEPGEVVSPGQEVLTVSDLSRVDLKVFVDETEIGKIRPGQQVAVQIDTFRDKTFPGSVAYISPEAEFTPKIIQTRKERVKLVYLVKISIDNPDHTLKSGMPADAWFK